MKKSVVSRIKITKKGKILRRKMSLDHFRTRKTKKNLIQKRKKYHINITKKQVLRSALKDRK